MSTCPQSPTPACLPPFLPLHRQLDGTAKLLHAVPPLSAHTSLLDAKVPLSSCTLPDETAFVWQHVVLLLYVGGMLVDEVLEGAHQYHGRIAMYFQSGFNIVEAICWLLLVASIGLKIAMWTVPDGQVGHRGGGQALAGPCRPVGCLGMNVRCCCRVAYALPLGLVRVKLAAPKTSSRLPPSLAPQTGQPAVPAPGHRQALPVQHRLHLRVEPAAAVHHPAVRRHGQPAHGHQPDDTRGAQVRGARHHTHDGGVLHALLHVQVGKKG